MKLKKSVYIVVFTLILLFIPCFIHTKKDVSTTNNLDNKTKEINKSEVDRNEMSVFSSNTCFKKTYYINKNKVPVYKNFDCNSEVLYYLYEDDIIVSYKEQNGYIFCEEGNLGRKGWIKKNKENLKGILHKNTEYKVDVDLIDQKIRVYKNDKIIKNIKCSTGVIGKQDTETPLGIFYITNKGKYFYSNKYNQGGRYYIKFFANYLIHSIPVDKNGNIIEEEKDKLGFPTSHGCIRVPMEDSKWLYRNIPNKSLIIIHY
ncbi:murein L,D-transpeptidase [Clostridium botulinum]|nr:murein L,D-transpeptidase [Clostridium botulinum]NFD35512.1 murein L,D-transpeptidase [Clostridium botulinum]NFD61341.1 murein L,D-transpeptidase [Clostridium botulinum]NFE03190.1 murein L,D-transpeptidase [Clostridium botulinum]